MTGQRADLSELAFHLEQLAGVIAQHEDELSKLRQIIRQLQQSPASDCGELPMPFIWAELEPETSVAYQAKLDTWVDWLVHRYRLDDHIPECWALHGAYLEELTALWIAWETAYRKPDNAMAAHRWHGELGWFLGRIGSHWKRQSCRAGAHVRPISIWTASPQRGE